MHVNVGGVAKTAEVMDANVHEVVNKSWQHWLQSLNKSKRRSIFQCYFIFKKKNIILIPRWGYQLAKVSHWIGIERQQEN